MRATLLKPRTLPLVSRLLVIVQRDEEDVVLRDKQDESESDGPPSKRREVLLVLTLLDEQLAALLIDEGVRVAIARAGKATAREERKELLSVPRKSNGSFISTAGPIQGAPMIVTVSIKAAVVTGIRTAPAPLQSPTATS